MRTSRRTLLALVCVASVLSVAPSEGATKKKDECPFKGNERWKCYQTQLMSRTPGAGANGASPAASVGDLDTSSPTMSLDGLSVAFSSDARNLVPSDSNGVADVFVRRTTTNEILRASTDARGRQANGASYSPSLSLDAKHIAFVSEATNLVPGDTNGVADIFTKNLDTGAIRRVSVRPGGAQANGDSNSPRITAFGDYITFDSDASNLSAGDDNGLSDAFLWTRASGAIRRLQVPAGFDEDEEDARILFDGIPHTGSASISADGKVIAYHRLIEPRQANANVPRVSIGDPVPLAADVFVEAPRVWEPKKLVPIVPFPDGCTAKSPPKPPCWRWQPGRWHGGTDIGNKRGLQRITMTPWGGQARKMLENPIVTVNNRYIAYEAWSAITLADTIRTTSDRSALARNDLGAACARRYGLPVSQTCIATDFRAIYLFDWYSELHFPVSTKVIGAAPNGDCYDPAPNAFGTVIAFVCDENVDNLIPGDTNQAPDVYVKDLPGRATTRVSLSTTHGEGLGVSNRPSISYEGRRIAFASNVSTFVPGDTNGASDVFLRDRLNHIPNAPPTLTPPFSKTQAIDVGEPWGFQLRASDPEDDLVRFGALTPLPDGARIDPASGAFTWTPSADQTEPGGKTWTIIVWATDVNGSTDLRTLSEITTKGVFWPKGNMQLLKIYVRDPGGTARCDAHALAPELIEGACEPVT